MKAKSYYFFFFLSVLLLIVPFSKINAQTQTKKDVPEFKWYVNFNGGSSLFLGDINDKGIWPSSHNGISEFRLGADVQFGWNISPVFDLRLQSMYGQLSGVKTSLNQYFQADYFEFNVNTAVNLNNLISGYKAERKWNFFILGGIGLTNYNSDIYNLSNNALIAQMGHGHGKGLGGRTIEGILLGGIGVNYSINKTWNIQLETANRFMNSDDMDHVKDHFKFDGYNYTSIGIVYRFGHRLKEQNRKPKPPSLPLLEIINNKEKTPPAPVTDTLEQKPVVKEVKQPEKQVQKPIKSPVRPILEYRVQIRARYGKPVDISYLSKKYNLPQTQIKTDKFKGYYIYTIGSYDNYLQAKTRRDIVRVRNKILDAFVVAFKNGRRLEKLP